MSTEKKQTAKTLTAGEKTFIQRNLSSGINATKGGITKR